MPAAPITVNLIGAGRIGGPVADWLRRSPRYRLQAVIGRGDPGGPPAALVIDTAGPGALRAFGAHWLKQGEVWSVGAAALLDPALREDLHKEASRSANALRLFTGWISGPLLCPSGQAAALHVVQSAPSLGPAPGLLFQGPLAEAGLRFPDHLNTATAAALSGPGIDATTIELHSTPPGGPHRITAHFRMPGQDIVTDVTFADGPHPVAQALIAALERRGAWLHYG